jgi:hypothetical protein
MSQEWSRGERRRNHFRSRCARRGGAGRVFPATAAIALLLLVGCGGQANSKLRASRLVVACLRLGTDAQAIHVRVSDSFAIEGAALGQSKAGVVLANQSDRDLCSWLRFARSLSRAGFGVLLFDYSGAGPQADVAAAAKELRRRGARSVALIGASEGGSSGARGWQPAYSGRGRRRQPVRREQGAYGPTEDRAVRAAPTCPSAFRSCPARSVDG